MALTLRMSSPKLTAVIAVRRMAPVRAANDHSRRLQCSFYNGSQFASAASSISV